MNIKMQNLSKNNLSLLLLSFSDIFLCEPFKNSKQLQQKVKGFRYNKIPKSVLDAIYIREILGNPNCLLANYLTDNILKNLRNLNLEKIVENFSDDPIKLGIEIEKITTKNDLDIYPHIVIRLMGIDCSDEHDYALTTIYDTLKEKNRSLITNKNNEIAALKEKFAEEKQELKKEFDNSKSEIRSAFLGQISEQKEKNAVLEAETRELHERLKSKNKSESELQKKYDLLYSKLEEFNKLNNQIAIKTEEIETLLLRINNLTQKVSDLELRSFSSKDINFICQEIIDDLNVAYANEGEIKKMVKEKFNNETSFVTAWNDLSIKALEYLQKISAKMDESQVDITDIEKLDEIENGIHIKFLIIKCLKVLIFKYLEKKSSNNLLENNFTKKDN